MGARRQSCDAGAGKRSCGAEAKCICPNCQLYLSKLTNVFVQFAKCISPSCKIHSCMEEMGEQIEIAFLQVTRYICPSHKMYLSIGKKLQSNEIWSISEAWRRWESR